MVPIRQRTKGTLPGAGREDDESGGGGWTDHPNPQLHPEVGRRCPRRHSEPKSLFLFGCSQFKALNRCSTRLSDKRSKRKRAEREMRSSNPAGGLGSTHMWGEAEPDGEKLHLINPQSPHFLLWRPAGGSQRGRDPKRQKGHPFIKR